MLIVILQIMNGKFDILFVDNARQGEIETFYEVRTIFHFILYYLCKVLVHESLTNV